MLRRRGKIILMRCRGPVWDSSPGTQDQLHSKGSFRVTVVKICQHQNLLLGTVIWHHCGQNLPTSESAIGDCHLASLWSKFANIRICYWGLSSGITVGKICQHQNLLFGTVIWRTERAYFHFCRSSTNASKANKLSLAYTKPFA
jgi:hypothetical protein